MTNPFNPHTSNLFASRGCDLDAAMTYAREVLDSISPDSRIAATTALMVVINTAANAFDQARGSSPERLALIELIDERISAAMKQETSIEDQIEEWFNENIDIEDKINDWMSDNFDVTDYNFNDAVSEWMNDNLADKISDIDLVVRAR